MVLRLLPVLWMEPDPLYYVLEGKGIAMLATCEDSDERKRERRKHLRRSGNSATESPQHSTLWLSQHEGTAGGRRFTTLPCLQHEYLPNLLPYTNMYR